MHACLVTFARLRCRLRSSQRACPHPLSPPPYMCQVHPSGMGQQRLTRSLGGALRTPKYAPQGELRFVRGLKWYGSLNSDLHVVAACCDSLSWLRRMQRAAPELLQVPSRGAAAGLHDAV